MAFVHGPYESYSELERGKAITRKRNEERRIEEEEKRKCEEYADRQREHTLLAQQKLQYELDMVQQEQQKIQELQEARRGHELETKRREEREQAKADAEKDEVRERQLFRLAEDIDIRRDNAERLQNAIEEGYIVMDKYLHLDRLLEKSEVRTPLLVSSVYEDPYDYIQILAKRCKTPVSFGKLNSRSNDHVLRLFDGCLNSGTWLYIEIADTKWIDHDVFRQIGKTLNTLTPTPQYPDREYFRMWVCTPEPVDLNDTLHPVYPAIFTVNSLCAQPSRSVSPRHRSPSSQKVVRKKPVDPELVQRHMKRAEGRQNSGRDSDSESDIDESDPSSPRKVFGPLFMRPKEG
eukprot:NODE_216_length_1155_cov_10.025292_g211_i0.p1 GENE.NODE_216_length_1155_cov_10.025292_g211_i0~~NODE_216_length_1155_cov_10.025292_g211_i0.p1  ORF type:complete len:348 (-),score=68.66 NODE_216_length_1155_cov_10.025292_g211_i0:57-1100(-)